MRNDNRAKLGNDERGSVCLRVNVCLFVVRAVMRERLKAKLEENEGCVEVNTIMHNRFNITCWKPKQPERAAR